MNKILIKDKEDNIVIYLDKKNIYGIRFKSDNSIEKVDNVLDYFKIFKLSNNNKELYELDGYKVIIDNETLIKHYFKDGKEDFEMLYKNNGFSCVLTSGSSLDSSKKYYLNKAKTAFIILGIDALTAVATFNGLNYLSNSVVSDQPTVNFESTVQVEPLVDVNISDFDISDIIGISNKDITTEDIRDRIFNSNSLSLEEKGLLYNENYFNTILPIVNESNYLKYLYKEKFDNIDIQNFTVYVDNEDVVGYYDPCEFSKIHVKDYNEKIDKDKDTIAHEFVHLCQDNSQYRFFSETCAELLGSEFFNYKVDAYCDEIKILEKFMEVVGSDIVLDYTIKGNFSKLENELKNYLDESEYFAFLYCVDDGYLITPEFSMNLLDSLVDTMYERKYNEKAEDSVVFKAIASDTMQRYYFNPQLVNIDSYYIDYNSGEEFNYSLAEAYSKKVLSIYALVKNEHTKEEAKLLEEQGTEVKEIIQSEKSNNLKIDNTYYVDGKYYISGEIQGEKLDNICVDELVNKGLVKLKYVTNDKVLITYDDLVNNKFPDDTTVEYQAMEGFNIEGDRVIGHYPSVVNLPPVVGCENVKSK